jgi:hypothetical protein
MTHRAQLLLAVGLFTVVLAFVGSRAWLERHGPDAFSHAPCAIPVYYQLTEIDPRFGFDRFTVASALAEAGSLWQTVTPVLLFLESDHPRAMEVSLSFDERQQAALTRRSLRGGIESDFGTLEAEQAELQAWNQRIETSREARDRHAEALAERVKRHEAEVADWNALPAGRSESRRRALAVEGDALRAELAGLEQLTGQLNADIQAYNRRAEQARLRSEDFRSRVSSFNAASSPDPVESGQYSYDPESGRRIEIFRAESFDELVWILAHELGHALGIGHVDEPGAIMHPLLHDGAGPGRPAGRPVALAPADIAALREVCGRRLP